VLIKPQKTHAIRRGFFCCKYQIDHFFGGHIPDGFRVAENIGVPAHGRRILQVRIGTGAAGKAAVPVGEMILHDLRCQCGCFALAAVRQERAAEYDSRRAGVEQQDAAVGAHSHGNPHMTPHAHNVAGEPPGHILCADKLAQPPVGQGLRHAGSLADVAGLSVFRF